MADTSGALEQAKHKVIEAAKTVEAASRAGSPEQVVFVWLPMLYTSVQSLYDAEKGSADDVQTDTYQFLIRERDELRMALLELLVLAEELESSLMGEYATGPDQSAHAPLFERMRKLSTGE